MLKEQEMTKMENSDSEQLANTIPCTLRLPFLYLSKLGLFSKNKFKSYFFMIVWGLAVLVCLVISLVQFLNIRRNQVSDCVRNLEGVAACINVLIKATVITCKQNDLVKLFTKTALFKIDDCDKLTKNIVIYLQKFFTLCTIVLLVFVLLRPILENSLSIGIWTLEGYDALYLFTLYTQPLILSVATVITCSVDCLYLAFCCEIIVQFRIICRSFNELTPKGINNREMELDYLEKFKICVQHHQLTIRFVKEFQHVFSLVILAEYLTFSPLLCAELYAVSEGQFNQMVVIHAFAFITCTNALAFYCVPANYIADEAMAVSQAVYFSNWYSYYFSSLKMPLLITIKNAQNEITIVAGGLIKINAGTVVNVVQLAWSIGSLMKGLKQY